MAREKERVFMTQGKKGIVYIMQTESMYGKGYVKIGHTSNIKKRLIGLSTSEVFGVFYAREYDDAQYIEQEILDYFADYRGRGEYFAIFWGDVAEKMREYGGKFFHQETEHDQGKELPLIQLMNAKEPQIYFEDLDLKEGALVRWEKDLASDAPKEYPLVRGKEHNEKHKCAILYGEEFANVIVIFPRNKPAPIHALSAHLWGGKKKRSGNKHFYVKNDKGKWENLFDRAKRLRQARDF